MNFFEHQEQSKKNTTLLVVLFALAVIAIILAVYTVITGVIYTQTVDARLDGIGFKWFDPEIFLGVALAVLMVIIGGSLFKIIALKRGGQYIAESLGGRLVNPGTSDMEEKKLINIVAEMALAAGTPVPLAYVLEQEKGINAFAAGYSPDDAVMSYNIAREKFPANLIAGMFNFTEAQLLESTEAPEERKAPKVTF